jgi:hypothetical protein
MLYHTNIKISLTQYFSQYNWKVGQNTDRQTFEYSNLLAVNHTVKTCARVFSLIKIFKI